MGVMGNLGFCKAADEWETVVNDHTGFSEPSRWRKAVVVAKRVPIINFMYFSFATTTPGVDEITTGLEALALISALNFAIVGSLVPAVSLGDCEVADKLYAKNGQYGCIEEIWDTSDWTGACSVLQKEIIWSIIFTAAPLMGSIIAIISLTSVSMSAADTGEDREENQEIIVPWWRLMRFPVLGCWVLFLIGGFSTLKAVKWILEIKFPQPFTAELCKSMGWVLGPLANSTTYYCSRDNNDCKGDVYKTDFDNPTFNYVNVGIGILIITMFFTAIMGGYGSLRVDLIDLKKRLG